MALALVILYHALVFGVIGGIVVLGRSSPEYRRAMAGAGFWLLWLGFNASLFGTLGALRSWRPSWLLLVLFVLVQPYAVLACNRVVYGDDE